MFGYGSLSSSPYKRSRIPTSSISWPTAFKAGPHATLVGQLSLGQLSPPHCTQAWPRELFLGDGYQADITCSTGLKLYKSPTSDGAAVHVWSLGRGFVFYIGGCGSAMVPWGRPVTPVACGWQHCPRPALTSSNTIFYRRPVASTVTAYFFVVAHGPRKICLCKPRWSPDFY